MHSSREPHDSTRHGFDAPPTSQGSPHAGDVLAERYRLERDVGRTEAGVVFDGIDLHLNRQVAVEIASSIEEPKARRKWARDAMLAQRLEGEHVLRVLDVGNLVGGVPYAVREAALCTMAAELEVKGALPIPVAVAWTLEACEAVAEAHALGMAHGDLRLDNVYLVRPLRGRDERESGEPTVKVAFTSAAKAERAAKEDVARDLAGLGAMLRVLSTGRLTDDEADGAPTLPTDLAHAVARALSVDPRERIQNVAELARMLAPYAPPGHASARNVAFLMSRAGIVAGALPLAVTAPPPPPSSRRPKGVVPAEPLVVTAPISTRDADRASFTDEWFGRAQRTPLRASLAPAHRPARPVFAMVSLALVALVLGGSWFLWQNGMLPRWTGAAPPEAVGNTEVTSGPAASPAESMTAEPAAAAAAPAAAAAATTAVAPPTAETASTSVESLPTAPTKRARANDPGAATSEPSTSTGGAGLRYVDPSSTTTTTVPSPNAPASTASPATPDTSSTSPSESPTSPASDSTTSPSSGSGSTTPSTPSTPESTPSSPAPSPGY